jgi:integrase
MKPRSECIFIDKPAFPLLPSEEPGVITIGPEPADCAQAPWPTYPTYWDVSMQYCREWVIPQRCDLSRTVAAIFRTLRCWDPMRDARTFSRADGRDFVNMRRADGVADGTIRRDLVMAAAAFSHALKEERIPKKPRFDMPAQSAPRLRFLTPDEHRKLMQLPKLYRRQLFWVLAFETGCRSKAIEELRWTQVDLVNRQIDFRQKGRNHKNKRRPVAYINERLLSALTAAKRKHDEKYPLDPYVIGAGSTTYQGCKDDLKAIGIEEVGVARHVARHTFCSWRIQAGFSAEHIGALIADNPGMVRKVYGHLAPDHLRAASEMDLSVLKRAA